MQKLSDILCSACTVITGGVALSDIQNVVSIITAVTCFVITLINFVYGWYKKAKKDGKVTAEEVAELINEADEKLKK